MRVISFFVFITIICACQAQNETLKSKGEDSMEIKSTAFEHEGMIPTKYTCDGQDISPPLSWSDVPDNTQSLALISDDPDAPMGTWVHWVVYNVPPDVTSLPENVPAKEELKGGLQGTNDFKKIGYGGPCPPGGTHRYFFKLYALDTKLDLEPGATKAEVEKAMDGHILAQAELIGRYQRQ